MAVVGLNAIDMMFSIPGYPFWALVIIAVDVVALWGLCAYGSRENLAVSIAAPAGEQAAGRSPGDPAQDFTRSEPILNGQRP